MAVSVAGMSANRSAWLMGIALISGVLGAVSMVGPWAASGRVDRSMFELISSASALDLLTGFEKGVVLAAVLVVTTSVAVALIAAAWSRRRAAAIALVGPGPILLASALVVARSPLALAWGAVAGSAAGIAGSISAIIVLRIGVQPPDPRS